VIEAGT
jgi:hypothetical protein